MGKKLTDIELEIRSKEEKFYRFLTEVLDQDILNFINILSKKTHVYLFSGIIRNYFLNNYLVRDVDLVVESDEEIDQLLKGQNYQINSFGGYKISIGKKTLDIWSLDKTWALKKEPKLFTSDLETHIPRTAFFNFSAIIYSLNRKKFIFTQDFLKFLSSKTLNYVYKPNLNHELCIVNTLYYSEKYKLKISKKLSNLISLWHSTGNKQYSNTQLNHFGEILYDDKTIEKWLKILN